MEHQHYFDIVKKARTSLQEIETERLAHMQGREHAPSETTIAGYERQAKMLMAGAESVAEVIVRARDTTSTRTWYRRRAALIYYLRAEAKDALKQQTRLQRTALGSSQWIAEVERLESCVELLQMVVDAPPLDHEQRKPRHSKKKDLRSLPDNWRQMIVKRMPTYRAAVLTAAITGCRPAELAMGVKWNLQDGKLYAFVWGAKVTETSGQEWREPVYPVEGELAEMMRDLLVANGGHLFVQIENPARFTGAVRSAGRRAFPRLRKDLTAYCFRHQVFADGKAGALASDNPEEALLNLSAALGHYSDKTRGIYGDACQARGGGVAPEAVSKHREVKQRKKPDFNSMKHHRGKSTQPL